jgi:peptidoglycan/xylan/chitin deacetylase (PgdA/CDA1 family)
MEMQRRTKSALERGLTPLGRALTSRRARILLYHRFSARPDPRCMTAELFESEVAYLARNFQVRSLSDVVARLNAGEPIEPGTVVLTVDDGYLSFLEHAYPVLLRYEVPATVFVVSEFISHGGWLWFDAVHAAVHGAAAGRHQVRIGDADRNTIREIRIDSVASRDAAAIELFDEYQMHFGDDPGAGLAGLQRDLNWSLPSQPSEDSAPMSFDQLRSLDPGLVEIGAHTRTHPRLSACAPERQREEIAGSKRDLEAQLARDVRLFCYPNGTEADFTRETASIVRDCGYISAVTTRVGLVDPDSDPFCLARVGAPADLRMFRNCVNGLWELRKKFAPWQYA